MLEFCVVHVMVAFGLSDQFLLLAIRFSVASVKRSIHASCIKIILFMDENIP